MREAPRKCWIKTLCHGRSAQSRDDFKRQLDNSQAMHVTPGDCRIQKSVEGWMVALRYSIFVWSTMQIL